MWDAIVARRAAQGGAAAAASTPPLAVVAGRARPARAAGEPRGSAGRSAWWLAAAASLTLATGVGIGRWWSVAASDSVARGGAPTELGSVAVTTPPSAGAPAAGSDATGGADAEDVARAAAEEAASDALRGREPSSGALRAQAALAAAPRRAPRATGPRDADVTYQLATLRHLTEVEALLVSYRDESVDDSVDVALDARLANWSRRLLDETRLLLDSPAADNPRRRRLLEDLELVLVQMSALESSAPDRERPLIDETLRHSRLMPRLRAAVPAGATGI
jgi:hypothetical protein